jgi:hypothetical protein
MNANSKAQMTTARVLGRSAPRRLRELGMELPAPPVPLGAYAEAVQTGM